MDLPNSGQLTLDEFLAHVSAQPAVWVRVAAIRVGDEWHQAILELTTGEAPPSWKNHELHYDDAIFLATRRKGSVVAGWLHKAQIRLSGCRVKLPELPAATYQPRRLDSGAPSQFEQLPWPSIVIELASASLVQTQPQELLAADGYHTFFNFYAAAAWFFWRDRNPAGGSVQRGVVYRHQDTSARITHVLFGNERVVVNVDGERLADTTVEVAGDVPGPSKRLTSRSSRSVRLPLSNGLPQGAFVVIRRGGQWLDRRFLKWPYATTQHTDVEEEQVEIEPATKLEFFLESREGQQVEFKRQLPGDTDDLKRKIMKTVGAFANGEGGSLLFGINDEYEVVGLPGADIADQQDRVSDLIDDWVSPRPDCSFEVYPVPDRTGLVVLALHVKEGPEPPYAIGTKNAGTQYYVRHAGRSVPARPNELRALARAKPPPPQVTRPFGLS